MNQKCEKCKGIEGLGNRILLAHLRGDELGIAPVLDDGSLAWRKLQAPHVRGCWALDLILGLS